MTPDLQHIVEALKACRERYRVTKLPGEEVWRLIDGRDESLIVIGYWERCQEAFDARCAEAMVRAIREPSNRALEAGLHGYMSGVLSCWQSVADAILGETQP